MKRVKETPSKSQRQVKATANYVILRFQSITPHYDCLYRHTDFTSLAKI